MKKTKPTQRLGMVILTMLLMCLGACKRNELQPPIPNILNSYRGTNKIVLQVVEELKKPDNRALLAELEKQGSINWECKVLITSRFMDGATLRFATGSNGDYLDAEVNGQTMAIRLYSKQQQEQRDAMAKQAFSKRLGGKSTQAGVCTYKVGFEVVYSSGLALFDQISVIYGIITSFPKHGFTVFLTGGNLQKQGHDLFFDAWLNETEADIENLLVKCIQDSCIPVLGPGINCPFTINGLEITGNCGSGPTVRGFNREQALNSLNNALWDHNACSAAKYIATSQFDALYQSYMANPTSASADIFRTRLSLLLSNVYGIVASYCNNGTDPGTPVNPGGGGTSSPGNMDDGQEIYGDYNSVYGFGGTNGVSDEGRLSCKSFSFTKLSATANSQEAGVRGLAFVVDWVGGKPAKIYNFRTIYVNVGVKQANGTIITSGKAAEIAADAANRAGASLTIKYFNKKEALFLMTSTVEAEFASLMTTILQQDIAGYGSVYFSPVGPRTIVKDAVWNGSFTKIFNALTGQGCVD